MMLKCKAEVIEFHINYINSIGHNYIKYYFDSDVIETLSNVIVNNKGIVMPKNIIKEYWYAGQLQNSYKIYNCTTCNTIIIFDDEIEVKTKLLFNNKIIARESLNKENLKPLNKFESRTVTYSHSIDNDIFKFSCAEMQIKNLLE